MHHWKVRENWVKFFVAICFGYSPFDLSGSNQFMPSVYVFQKTQKLNLFPMSSIYSFYLAKQFNSKTPLEGILYIILYYTYTYTLVHSPYSMFIVHVLYESAIVRGPIAATTIYEWFDRFASANLPLKCNRIIYVRHLTK